jgi:hypothetical protein
MDAHYRCNKGGQMKTALLVTGIVVLAVVGVLGFLEWTARRFEEDENKTEY